MVLKKVILALEDGGIEYMITGSIASSLQGEPRATHDVDIVVGISKFEHNSKKIPPACPEPSENDRKIAQFR